jgi:RNA polymerase sigma-70 factor (ECF subfamily)
MGAPLVERDREAVPVPAETSGARRSGSSGDDGGTVDFETWYRALHPRLVAALLLTSGRADEAGEAADEALARALERWASVGVMASPDGWTFQVASNVLRRRGRRRALEERMLRRTSTDFVAAIPAPAGEAWDAVKHLPQRQREVVVLRYIADLPEAEIATVLGISRGTVSSTLTDARRSLGRMLGDDLEMTA